MEETTSFDKNDDMVPYTPRELRNIFESVIEEIETSEDKRTPH